MIDKHKGELKAWVCIEVEYPPRSFVLHCFEEDRTDGFPIRVWLHPLGLIFSSIRIDESQGADFRYDRAFLVRCWNVTHTVESNPYFFIDWLAGCIVCFQHLP